MFGSDYIDSVVRSFFKSFFNGYVEKLDFDVAFHDGVWVTAVHRKNRQSFSFRLYEHFQGTLVDISYSGRKHRAGDCFSWDDDDGLNDFGRKACRRLGLECKTS